jgi:acyl carrier protein
MKCSLDEMVCDVVARHLDVDRRAIDLRKTVDRDLELDPLDLVLIAIRIEELADLEFPIARLESVHTIEDLTKIARAAYASRFQLGSSPLSQTRRRSA